MENGLNSGSYLTGCDEAVEYFSSKILAANEEPVTLLIRSDSIEKRRLAPDFKSLECPDIDFLDAQIEEIDDLWEISMKTWSDSLRIFKSVQYNAIIAYAELEYRR